MLCCFLQKLNFFRSDLPQSEIPLEPWVFTQVNEMSKPLRHREDSPIPNRNTIFLQQTVVTRRSAIP